MEKAEAWYRERYDQLFPSHARLFPGVKSLLTSLRRAGYLLAAASNKLRPYSQAILAHLGIDTLLQVVVCQDDVGGRLKPDPAMLLAIMERLEQSPPATLYVGDTVIDIEAGRRAQIDTVVVLTGSEHKEALQAASPAAILPSVVELPRYLHSLS
ncbi:MAG: HAD family hydrolase [Nitrospinota bacterium]|nr:MAG: HAD family hydrolase [Nitrospinota bacterium]